MDAIVVIPYDIPVFMLFPWAFVLWRWLKLDSSYTWIHLMGLAESWIRKFRQIARQCNIPPI
jgi:hypothetical protein